MPTNHFHNQTTFSLVRLILDVALAAFDCCVFISHITQSALEHGEKCLTAINTIYLRSETHIGSYFVVQLACKACLSVLRSLTELGLCGIEIVLVEEDIFVKRKGSISRFRRVQGSQDQLRTYIISLDVRHIQRVVSYFVLASL